MKKQYIKPAIVVVRQKYGEGLMQSWSTGSNGDDPGQGAKPGDTWTEPLQDETWNDPKAW